MTIEFIDGAKELVTGVESVERAGEWLILRNREYRTIKTFSSRYIKAYTRWDSH